MLWVGLFCAVLITGMGGCITGLGLWSAPVDLLLIGAAVVIVFGIFLGLLMVCFRKSRDDGVSCLTFSVLLLLFSIPSFMIGDKMRSYGFYLATERAKPLIAAIENYKKDNAALPSSLAALTPKYIDRIPYGLPPLELAEHDNGVWELSANTSTGALNWDIFYYLSDKNYQGSSIERIGDWAYLHE